jgi:outer membrane protein assembly factor BamD
MSPGFRHLLLAGAVSLLLQACAAKDEAPYVERPVGELYNSAVNQLESDNFNEAARQFEEVERQHPYSQWATKAKIMAAYSYYQANKYDDAIIALDRFIQLHPAHPDTPYAYYLKGLSYYEQISDVTRDQKMTEQALSMFTDLMRRFPDSTYARDARLKTDLARDHLAGKEMEIGRTYQRQGHYLAAINRFRAVVDNHQTTTHVPEALHRMVESYLALGVTEEARRIAAVLGHNFPGDAWYGESYALLEGRIGQPPAKSDPWYKIW